MPKTNDKSKNNKIIYKETSNYEEIKNIINENEEFYLGSIEDLYFSNNYAELKIKYNYTDFTIYFDKITSYEVQYINFDNIIYSADIGRRGKNKYIEIENEKMCLYIASKKLKLKMIDNNKTIFTYASIKYNENQDRTFYYLSDIEDLKEGDYVLVPARDIECTGIVAKVEEFTYDNLPFPLQRTKKIVKKITREEFEEYNDLKTFGNLEKKETIKVYDSKTGKFKEMKIIGKYEYLGGLEGTDLIKGKIYYRVEPKDEFRIIDGSKEDYLYLPDYFKNVENRYRNINMDNKIIFYELNGEINKVEELNNENLKDINGMMTRCILKDGNKKVGYADTLRTREKDSTDNKIYDYILLWTWSNLDEKNNILIGDENSKYNQTFNKVNIDEIIKVEAILHSNPRWGGKLTNEFFIDK